MDDNHMSTPNEETRDGALSSVDDNLSSRDEGSSTKSDTGDAPIAPKQTRSSAWGAASATAVQNKQRSSAALADIMIEQESEKIKHENTRSSKVKFSDNVESEEERMMRLAIEASLRDQQHDEIEDSKQLESALKNSGTSLSNSNDDMDEDIKMAIALSLASANVSNDGRKDLHEYNDNTSDDRKPSAIANDSTEVTYDDDNDMKPSATDANNEDDSEKLARALHEAEIEEYNSSQASQDAAAEAASLALALQLQREEDSRHLNNVTIENANRAAQLKREAMCRGDSVATTGIRTVSRDEFQRMQGAKSTKGYGSDRIADRRRDEERGMGKLLKTHYPEDDSGDAGGAYPCNDVDSYYYYANDRFQEDEEDHYEEEYFGIRMNSQSASSNWQRLDKDTFIGPNNEIKSKHDPELKHKSNAMNLLDGNGGKSTAVSDRAYNAFRRSEARQSGMKKGVLTQGHGRAENMNAAKTRGGAMDGNVRLQIAAAVNMGLIERCNGVVKEGKEGLVYHAESARKGVANRDASMEEMDSDGHDVAVKVFKRISEFRNRREYIDGDPRYVKQKFKTNDAREQVVLWTEKEYRNLLRAWRGISVPKPIYQTNNILFMRFLGDDGWPSPQLREIEIKKGSGRWTTLYCQTLVAIRRLYHCARLIHGDLSEYNILVCPKWQVKKGLRLSPSERTGDDDDLQVVLIDFGQAVDVGHLNATEFLQRDLATVGQFFANQGITTLTSENAEQFVVETIRSDTGGLNDDYEEEAEGAKKTSNWRNIAETWDENIDMEALMARLELK